MAILSSGEVVTVSRTLTLISNHGMLLLQAALAGDGIVFLPIWGAAEGLANGTLEEVALEDARMVAKTGAEMSVLALYHPEKARLGKVRAMVDFLVEDLGEA